ncbi:hypothetical protein RHSIM_Rhsim04G0017600 [Rhododendron simsii]|uniref:Uncharacterized protein n=1 Tax=Rhododendron simsii TaxID=118357 RepID=A0A834H332_RHOSS|nr:hypothetical protein RHSIM_Rhsim04G0017600 [Rhododendron simsii]
MMNVAVALFLVLSSLVTVEPEVCSPPQEKPPNPPPEDAIVVEHSTHRVKQVLDRARDVKEHAQEAVSEALSKAKDFVPRKTSEVSDVIRAACRISYDFGQTTANKVSSAVTEKVVPTVNQYVPGERGRAKIGRFATSFVRNAAVYGLPEVLKYWVPAEDSKQKVKEVLDIAREVKEHAKEAVSEALIKAKDSVGYRTSEVSNKVKDVIGATYQISYDFSRATAAKVSGAVTEKVVPTVNQYMPDERGRAKIGRFATSFVKNAAVYGLPVVLGYWFPGGVPVFDIASQSLRDVKTEDYEAKTKTEHCKEELKRLLGEVDKLERELSGGAQNIQDDVKPERESSVGKDNRADAKFESGAASFKCAPEGRRNDQNVYDE